MPPNVTLRRQEHLTPKGRRPKRRGVVLCYRYCDTSKARLRGPLRACRLETLLERRLGEHVTTLLCNALAHLPFPLRSLQSTLSSLRIQVSTTLTTTLEPLSTTALQLYSVP